MLPNSLYKFRISSYKSLKKPKNFVQRSNLYKKTLENNFQKNSLYLISESLQTIPLVPVISFIQTKTGAKSELKFKYIWGWKRPKQNYIFMSKLNSTNVNSLNSFYF